MGEPLRIVFAGTPPFALPCLEALAGSIHRVVAAYTQPDRPAGRGRKLQASPVKVYALGRSIPVAQPASLKSPEEERRLAALQPDLMVVVAYGLILPRTILATPRLGCINVHASLLPRWRGAAPIQRAILAGDPETGVTVMQMDAGLDTGVILDHRSCQIERGTTAQMLHDRLSALGAQALTETLEDLPRAQRVGQAQDERLACYASKIEKGEAEIDWSQPAPDLERKVCAFDPWPVASTFLEHRPLRIWTAQAVDAPEDHTDPPGTVVGTEKYGIDVTTGNGLLRLLRLQLPGAKVVSAAEFLNAHPIRGARLGMHAH